MIATYLKLEGQINAQQEGLPPESPVYAVGEQLKEIARASEKACELLYRDLDRSGMGIANAEKKLKAYADALHAENNGSSVCIPPNIAERILREFYGIPADISDGQKEQKATAPDLIDLSTFF